eukprot:13986859-Alexandrium_andersonii.AAC.1
MAALDGVLASIRRLGLRADVRQDLSNGLIDIAIEAAATAALQHDGHQVLSAGEDLVVAAVGTRESEG